MHEPATWENYIACFAQLTSRSAVGWQFLIFDPVGRGYGFGIVLAAVARFAARSEMAMDFRDYMSLIGGGIAMVQNATHFVVRTDFPVVVRSGFNLRRQ